MSLSVVSVVSVIFLSVNLKRGYAYSITSLLYLGLIEELDQLIHVFEGLYALRIKTFLDCKVTVDELFSRFVAVRSYHVIHMDSSTKSRVYQTAGDLRCCITELFDVITEHVHKDNNENHGCDRDFHDRLLE